ncbi:histidine kinase dimerization/phosphoacceptor domain -containing protein [Rhodohalobacter halophilus]|uniref:histidine kinase dimerization/phosphoacceptor domain -containing protein n=1 Tax=Rhodohalobacter halophilus TaxID=1812810 RepID=UPI00083F5C0A|nr:histidine kinase dimerization/phosphoacceptor domain -containing protein [Rhodohalobacter halophilus]
MNKISPKGLAIGSVVALLLIFAFYYGWSKDQKQLREARIQTLESTAGLLKDLFEETVNEHLNLAYNHKSRVEFTEGRYFENFEFETGLLLNVKLPFRFFEWIDSDGVIRLIEPYEENREAIGLNILDLDYRRDEWLQMKRDSTLNMTGITDLVQGNSAFLIDAPIYYNNEFHGSLTVGMDFTDEFNALMAGREMFNLRIWDHHDRLFYQFGFEDGENSKEYITSLRLDFISGSDNYWKMELAMNEHFYSGREALISQVGLFFRIVVGVMFGFLIYFMMASYKANKRNEAALKEKEVLISEIHHRVKNNLAIISSLIDLQRMDAEDEVIVNTLIKTQNRIQSIAGVHELLYRSDTFSEIPFDQYLQQLINKHLAVYLIQGKDIDIQVNCTVKSMSINQAIPLGLLMSELVTNSFKHAFKEREKGIVKIHIFQKGDFVEVTYQDDGKGFDKSMFENSTGMGITIIKTLINQLGSNYKVDSENGFRIRFKFKLDS